MNTPVSYAHLTSDAQQPWPAAMTWAEARPHACWLLAHVLQHQQHAQGRRHQGHIAEKAAVDGRARAQKRVTLEEAYGSSSQEDGDEPREAHKEDDDASSASELDVKGLDQVPDSDCSSDASMASEAESPSPPAKRKVCQDGTPSQVAGRMTKCCSIEVLQGQ